MVGSNYDLIYSDIVVQILEHGNDSGDRTGVGTKSMFGLQYTLNLQCERINSDLVCHNFPLLTSKRIYWRGVLYELLWMLSGDTDIRYLLNNKVNIWNDDAYRNYRELDDHNTLTKSEFIDLINRDVEFANKYADLGKIYGYQWRKKHVDQIATLIENINHNPNSRRLIVNSWSVDDIHEMALPPCHNQFQCYVNDGKLSLHLYQRSCDVGLGLPFNTPSYAMLMMILAQLTDTVPDKLIHTFGDIHIYNNHIDGLTKQISVDYYEPPSLKLGEVKHIDNINVNNISIMNYKSNTSVALKMNT